MMKSKNVLPLILGLVGAALRFLQCRTVFEPDTMLARPHFLSVLLPIFLILCAAYFAMKSGKKETALDFDAAFRTPDTNLLLGFNFSSLLFIPVGIYTISQHMSSKLMLLFGAGAAIAGACLFLGILSWHRERPSGTMLLIPVFFGILWLFTTYQDYASWPVIEAYFVQVFSIAATTYGFYQVSACAFSQGSRRALQFSLPTAVVLAFTALGDSVPLPVKGLYLASLGALYGFYLCLNDENK